MMNTDQIKSKEPVIEINGLKKSFGQQEVLKNISLTLINGENIAVLANRNWQICINTMYRCLLHPDSGSIKVFDKMWLT